MLQVLLSLQIMADQKVLLRVTPISLGDLEIVKAGAHLLLLEQ